MQQPGFVRRYSRSEPRLARTPATKIYDITIPFSADLPVWPGDPAIEIRPLSRIVNGNDCNTSQIVCPTHCGTHVDPSWHFIDDGSKLDQVPIERWVGPCQVVRIPNEVATIEPADLESAEIDAQTTRILFKTSNSTRWKSIPLTFETDFVALSFDATKWLIAHGIKLVGIDYLSFESYHSEGSVVHRTLLGNDVLAIEGLDLSEVEPGFYQLVCLPLKLKNGDGAPARVVLMSYDE
jgi:arylformamidase